MSWKTRWRGIAGSTTWGGWLIIMLALFFAFFPIVWIMSASVNQTGTLNVQRLIPQELRL